MEKVSTIGKFWHKASIEIVTASLLSIFKNLKDPSTKKKTTIIAIKTIPMASKKYSYSASLNSNGPVKDIAKTYIFRNLSKNIVTLSKKFIFFEFKKYPTINGNKINKESCARVSKKLNENSSAFIEMILNQNTVVNGVINEVNVVKETESGIFPPL